MTFLLRLAVLATAVLATEVDVVWRHEKSSGLTSLSVFSSTHGSLISETCGSIITADVPIDFSDLDDDGSGTFTVGRTKYTAHSNPEKSGGPACSKKYNGEVALLQCAGVDWAAKNISTTAVTGCFQYDDSDITFAHLEGRKPAVKRQEKRQICHADYGTRLVGDGDPHQNFYHKQLSSDPFIIWSPNEANRGGGYYCVVGTCRAQGDAYWDYSGREGGP
ncbi:hypothetical protein G7Z17_g1443 [Cylindrodendrum hubeiense]|uniref:Uncharacterized protein n=1 Tax=Cylindrodendrum hubeiense TaxID=595255 RepID=A0A9P5HG32_9HYPO|nr:hypothetical protein G7Z17_g1443 [Cylindrodendrum hubeiense]